MKSLILFVTIFILLFSSTFAAELRPSEEYTATMTLSAGTCSYIIYYK